MSVGGEGDRGNAREREKEWVPRTPRFRLPEELTLPLPSVGGGLLSPVRRAGMMEMDMDGRTRGRGKVGLAV
jgi:hypothetical protein